VSHRVFFVEDDGANRLIFALLMEEEGWEVVTASSCEQARAVLATGGSFDAAILDRALGDGDGIQLLALVRGIARRVIVLSGTPGARSAAGVDATLEKGGDVGGTLARIRELLET
jgi:DNA-binding response OmpR family regulator